MFDVIVSAGDTGDHNKKLARITQKRKISWPDLEKNPYRLGSCGGLLAEKDEVCYSLEAFPYPSHFNRILERGNAACSQPSQMPVYS